MPRTCRPPTSAVFPATAAAPAFAPEERRPMGHQTVQEAMTSNPTAITPKTTVQEAARSGKSEDVGALPIVEDGRLTYVITDHDLAIRGVATGSTLRHPCTSWPGRCRHDRSAAETRGSGTD